MSIRLRLTLLYSGILACTLIIFSVVLYVLVARFTLNWQEQALAEESAQILTQGEFRLTVIRTPQGKIAIPQTFVQTRDLSGQVVSRSINLNGYELPLSPKGFAALRDGEANGWLEIVRTENGRLLIYSRAVISNGQPVGILQVARSLADLDQALATLRQYLIVGTLVSTITAFFGGWVLAGASLRPINRITQTAREIGRARDFGRRVEYEGPNDEIGALVTTLNEMLTELQAAYQQVEQALVAQRRFVADASHELRTPLTTLRGNVELLQREPPLPEEERRAILADITAELDRMIRLVRELLTLARVDAGLQPRLEPVELGVLLEEAVRQAQLLRPRPVVRARVERDAVVRADRDLLRQVLLILLDNALKYTPENGDVEVTTVIEGKRAGITVRDTGVGIDPAILPHIFERFFRGDTARSGEGTGLGLAIAKSLVEAMHGEIRVTSRPGVGSAFTVLLPLEAELPAGDVAERTVPALVGLE
ncbi:HAMP domain-containing histidine kinase [Thermomicrobium sp. CFH 73360]|uniref:sensor histidine kinase n=1 Tax=Thermomicrobium sp. CFH 73360 TaxID=2951987 RepID=UPI0020771164|nr:HAMP domain-containing sensor histidine kinase [Thermomicrobium sp. CFH 73360]MCM8746493.1 HAMP domain-containing histidine kinase [Thermomicrobium sp. CFH 73360]